MKLLKINANLVGAFINNLETCIFILRRSGTRRLCIIHVHIENYHLARHMWVCGQQAACLLSDLSQNSFQNLEVFLKPECSSAAHINVKICLSEPQGACNQKATWAAF